MEKQIAELNTLCASVRELLHSNNVDRLEQAKEKIAKAMQEYPDAAQPHNLMGIVKEIENDHDGAMKHFRAAYALNPKDKVVRMNMDSLCAFILWEENYCLEMKKQKIKKKDIQ